MTEESQNGSSSSTSEMLTIAYTESVPRDSSIDESSDEESDTLTSSWDESFDSESNRRTLFAPVEELKDKEEIFGLYPVWRTMSTSKGPKLDALDYFWKHYIFQLFTFLISHLLAHMPDEPIPFLVDLLDRCLSYRDRGGDPPLLFEETHVCSIYTALDPMDLGTITYNQYLTGMTTLGLTEFDLMPEGLTRRSETPKDIFIREAKRALFDQLDKMLGQGQPLGAPSTATVDLQFDLQSSAKTLN